MAQQQIVNGVRTTTIQDKWGKSKTFINGIATTHVGCCEYLQPIKPVFQWNKTKDEKDALREVRVLHKKSKKA